MNITVMAGVSGCGKSTYVNKMNEPVCSTDKFIDYHAKEHGVNYSDSFTMIQNQQLFSTIHQNYHLVLQLQSLTTHKLQAMQQVVTQLVKLMKLMLITREKSTHW